MGEAFRGRPEEGRQFAHGHTFAGNPLACAAGHAVIDVINEQNLSEKAVRLGEYLRTKLACLKKYGVIREIRGKGVLLGIELVRDTKSMAPFPELGNELKKTAIENGIILRVDPSWFAVAPPLIADEADLDEMCHLIDVSLRAALDRVRP
jgi:adenosylmethionine-8-amino-7-oxononanoate aminotransferase